MYPQIIVNELYEEGDRDLLFFGFIAGPVNYDLDDNSYGKPDEIWFEDVIKLICYLVETGYFSAGRMLETDCGVKFVPYENGFSEFEADARQCMHDSGLHGDALSIGLTIKKVHLRKVAPLIPESIRRLLQVAIRPGDFR